MKKYLLIISITLLTLMSCTKEEDLSGFVTRSEFEQWQNQDTQTPNSIKTINFNVFFPAANEAYEVTTTYNGLQGEIDDDDIVIIYFNTAYGWMQLPFEFGNISIVYGRTSDNTIVFRKGRALHLTFTEEAETWAAKAVIIPSSVYSDMKCTGVDFSSIGDISNY